MNIRLPRPHFWVISKSDLLPRCLILFFVFGYVFAHVFRGDIYPFYQIDMYSKPFPPGPTPILSLWGVDDQKKEIHLDPNIYHTLGTQGLYGWTMKLYQLVNENKLAEINGYLKNLLILYNQNGRGDPTHLKALILKLLYLKAHKEEKPKIKIAYARFISRVDLE